jgi:hypothetical protein
MSALEVQEGGDHYKRLKIQPVEYIHANNLPFIEGSVIKYVSRWKNKNGIADLRKARHFLDLLIELETENEKSNTDSAKALRDKAINAARMSHGGTSSLCQSAAVDRPR